MAAPKCGGPPIADAKGGPEAATFACVSQLSRIIKNRLQEISSLAAFIAAIDPALIVAALVIARAT